MDSTQNPIPKKPITNQEDAEFENPATDPGFDPLPTGDEQQEEEESEKEEDNEEPDVI